MSDMKKAYEVAAFTPFGETAKQPPFASVLLNSVLKTCKY